MPVEIEAKMKVDDLAAIRRRLKQQGAQRIRQVVETNTFFDRPDRGLRSSDRGLRVRRMLNVDSASESAVMTFKGPRQPGPLKSREELEITVDDPQTAILLLERLGFQTTLAFEKRRESWTLQNCQVELDELPYLGSFVEIEGPDEQSVQDVRKLLELADSPMIQASYISMLSDYVEQSSPRERIVRFPNPQSPCQHHSSRQHSRPH